MEINAAVIKKIHGLLDHGLTSGLGKPKPGEACVEAVICMALGLPHGDDPKCVLPVLRSLKIALNDSDRWTSNKARAEGLRRLAIAQLGSDTLDTQDFLTRVARMTIQTVVPSALRSAARVLTGEHPTKLLALALKCESEPTEANAKEAHAAANAANADAYAAANAAAYADADAYAAANAAAYAAANAAAYAAAYAAYAANAAAYAGEEILVTFAENVVQILIEMKAPGVTWLEVA